jgi:hypothetical protein
MLPKWQKEHREKMKPVLEELDEVTLEIHASVEPQTYFVEPSNQHLTPHLVVWTEVLKPKWDDPKLFIGARKCGFVI